MAKHHVYSTLSTGMTYTNYSPSVSGGLPAVESKVFIEGGANVANSHLITPSGVLTTIDGEQLEILQKNEVFKRHVDGGFIRVVNKKADPDAVAADMTKRDDSSPATPSDYADKTSGAKPAKMK